MPRPKKTTDNDGQLDLLDARERITTAPCVPAIRQAVAAWKADGYKGITNTTRTLLAFWFGSDHRLPSGRRFRYHDAQREAIETLIYLYEVAKVRRHKDLVEEYYRGKQQNKADVLKLLQYDDFARYCTKMATGSGKTKVMSLAIVWQYMNAVCENNPDYARTFLILAPNVIVFERLKTDFAGGAIFRTDPIIPKELEIFWDLDCYMRGDNERATSEGALYLTNIQQLHGKTTSDAADAEPDPLTAMLGTVPPTKKIETVDFIERL
ncbi:MAG: DEAD/DEAH box helicase family protein, partial [Fibrella sp.]|nr:DEAD/DEAH box helicase family protein [Armatimonadota bacterium]